MEMSEYVKKHAENFLNFLLERMMDTDEFKINDPSRVRHGEKEQWEYEMILNGKKLGTYVEFYDVKSGKLERQTYEGTLPSYEGRKFNLVFNHRTGKRGTRIDFFDMIPFP